jgi:hypothetical protein
MVQGENTAYDPKNDENYATGAVAKKTFFGKMKRFQN